MRWRLKKGVTWHDGKPFTADDCVFTWEYARDPATAAVTIGVYKDVTVTKVDDYTILVSFQKPTPFWATAFVAAEGMIIPKHLFGPYTGAKSRDAPTNLKPVGTGPYKFVDFKPGDMVRGEINTELPHAEPAVLRHDRDEGRRRRDLGGARRAADRRVRLRLEPAGRRRGAQAHGSRRQGQGAHRARAATSSSSSSTSPTRGTRSTASAPASRASTSPSATRRCARRWRCCATARACRSSSTAAPASRPRNFLNNPPRFRSPNTKWEFNVDKANQLLDAAGWKKGADGIREKGGKKLKFVYQTSINAHAPEGAGDRQAGVPEGRHRPRAEVGDGVGVLLVRRRQPRHLRQVLVRHADVHDDDDAPDAERFMDQYMSREVSQKANKWQGRNICRWRQRRVRQALRGRPRPSSIRSSARRCYIKMNDMVVNDYVVIPLISRPRVRGGNLKLVTTLSGWDLDFSALQNWYRESAPADAAAARRGERSRRAHRAIATTERPCDERDLRRVVEDVRAAAWRGATSSHGWRRSASPRRWRRRCSQRPASRSAQPAPPTSRPGAAAAGR